MCCLHTNVLLLLVLSCIRTRFPDYLSKNAVDLVKGLLAGDESQRLGGTKEKRDQLRAHPFFERIDWVIMWLDPHSRSDPLASVKKKLPPPLPLICLYVLLLTLCTTKTKLLTPASSNHVLVSIERTPGTTTVYC